MSTAKGLRRVRAGQGAALLVNVGVFASETLQGHPLIALISVACVVIVALAMRTTTGNIRRCEYRDRPRPDYCAVARMEQAIYGETFEHAGAPQRPARREAEKETTAGRECGCGSPERVDAGAFGTLLRLIGGAADHAIAGETAALHAELAAFTKTRPVRYVKPPGRREWHWEWRCSCGAGDHGDSAAEDEARDASEGAAQAHAAGGCTWEASWNMTRRLP
jgi:hypothetical protein